MICASCKQREATIHIEEVNTGSSIALCAECAASQALAMIQDNPAMSILNAFLKSLETAAGGGSAPDDLTCPRCGLTVSDMRQMQRLGCSDCYDAFHDLLMPMLAGMHRATIHTGMEPVLRSQQLPDARVSPAVVPVADAAALRRQLDAAVRDERYERAAELRDEIQRLRAEANTGTD